MYQSRAARVSKASQTRGKYTIIYCTFAQYTSSICNLSCDKHVVREQRAAEQRSGASKHRHTCSLLQLNKFVSFVVSNNLVQTMASVSSYAHNITKSLIIIVENKLVTSDREEVCVPSSGNITYRLIDLYNSSFKYN